MSHACHAEGCQRKVPPRLLFCAPHWKLVPPEWQRWVWRTYRPGQEKDKNPSAQYLVVQAMVVAFVAIKDGLWTVVDAEAHVKRRCDLVWRDIDREWVASLPPLPLAGT